MIVLDEQLLGRGLELEIARWYRGPVRFIEVSDMVGPHQRRHRAVPPRRRHRRPRPEGAARERGDGRGGVQTIRVGTGRLNTETRRKTTLCPPCLRVEVPLPVADALLG